MHLRALSSRQSVAAAVVATLSILLATLAAGAPPVLSPPKPAQFGELFPAGSYTNLNAGAGGEPRVDLRSFLGKKAVVFYYWIPENTRSEEIFAELQQLVDEAGAGKVALLGVATAPIGVEGKQLTEWIRMAKERAAALKLRVPVLHDEVFRLGNLLLVRSVPNISIVDAEGRLRLTNGGSLRETIEYKMDLTDAIRRLAQTGRLGTYGALPTYYPATELVGKKSPDFEAPAVGGGTRRWSSLFVPDRVNILIFWSVDCPHCKKALPEIDAWLKKQGDGFNVVTVAKVENDATKTKTEEYCKLQGFGFTTLVGQGAKIGNLYYITSTPTIFIIRPDGVIDSVLFSGEMDYGPAFEAKRKKILAGINYRSDQ